MLSPRLSQSSKKSFKLEKKVAQCPNKMDVLNVLNPLANENEFRTMKMNFIQMKMFCATMKLKCTHMKMFCVTMKSICIHMKMF